MRQLLILAALIGGLLPAAGGLCAAEAPDRPAPSPSPTVKGPVTPAKQEIPPEEGEEPLQHFSRRFLDLIILEDGEQVLGSIGAEGPEGLVMLDPAGRQFFIRQERIREIRYRYAVMDIAPGRDNPEQLPATPPALPPLPPPPPEEQPNAGDRGIGRGALQGDLALVEINGRETRVRLAGIVAPPIRREPARPEHELGETARRLLERRLANRPLRLELVGPDNEGPPAAFIFSGRLNLNVILVQLGYARFNAGQGTTPYDAELAQAERRAREAEAGIWRFPHVANGLVPNRPGGRQTPGVVPAPPEDYAGPVEAIRGRREYHRPTCRRLHGMPNEQVTRYPSAAAAREAELLPCPQCQPGSGQPPAPPTPTATPDNRIGI